MARGAIGAVLALLAAGHLACAPESPPASVGYYLSSREDLLRAHRIVLAELVGDDNYPQIGRGMTDALFQAVQERRLFQVTILGRDAPGYERLIEPARRPCSLRELLTMRDSLDCDAVLLG
jgi:hypothetical protein